MDLQSVLLCPKSNVSSQYYKTKLIVYVLLFMTSKENWDTVSCGTKLNAV